MPSTYLQGYLFIATVVKIRGLRHAKGVELAVRVCQVLRNWVAVHPRAALQRRLVVHAGPGALVPRPRRHRRADRERQSPKEGVLEPPEQVAPLAAVGEVGRGRLARMPPIGVVVVGHLHTGSDRVRDHDGIAAVASARCRNDRHGHGAARALPLGLPHGDPADGAIRGAYEAPGDARAVEDTGDIG